MSGSTDDHLVRRLKKFRKRSKAWLDWVVAALQITFALFVLSGSLLVFAYLRSVGAPVPAADLAAMTSLFLSISLLFSAFGSIGVMFVLLPTLTGRFLLRGGTFGLLVAQIDATGGNVPRRFKRFMAPLNKMFLVHGAFYLGLIGFFCGVAVQGGHIFMLLAIGFPMILGGGLSTALAKRVGRSAFTGVSTTRSAETLAAGWSVFGHSMLNALIGLLWSMTVLRSTIRLFSTVLEKMSNSSASLFLLGLLLLIALIYSWPTFVSDRIRVAIAFVAVYLLLFAALLQPYSIGAFTLRLLGVGGGLPISIALENQSEADAADTKHACLVLNSGSQIILAPEQSGSTPCAGSRAPFSTQLSLKPSSSPSPLPSLEILPMARVRQIQLLPNSIHP